ncbi:C-type lectin domain family 2 member D-like isoform X1 [Elgaria multicarinata webbii]|uniref:C-type lectin domain family 2 member D-like isoform X1 n=1 Tax=Elgaria multicarinata webbii TaxID=159646 RepID=UPI002FCCDF78
MANKEPETNVRERKNLMQEGDKKAERQTSGCGQATNKIRTLLENITLVKFIALLYRVVILFLLVAIGVAVAIAAEQIQQLAQYMASPAICGPPCPRYWIGYEGKCYYFSKEKRNWMYSQKFCSLHNASLAKIEPEEMNFVMRLKGKDIYWIGLRRNPGQPWKWTNGVNSTLEVMGDGGDCAFLSDETTAISSRCRMELLWICRKSDILQCSNEPCKSKKA